MPFTYWPLDDASGEIRLLTIPVDSNSLEKDDTIRCHLRHVKADEDTLCKSPDLDDASSRETRKGPRWGGFAALSYEWGPLEPKQTIFVDEQPFQVTTNLWRALLSVRESFSDRCAREASHHWTHEESGQVFRLWVDAICIDQTNIEERNLQVPSMRYVYAAASLVYCFLTPLPSSPQTDPCDETQDHDMDLAVKAMQTLREVTYRKVPQAEFLLALQQKVESISSDHWSALSHFFGNSYWNRLWIVQELALAAGYVCILVGTHTLKWEDAHRAAWVTRTARHFIANNMYRISRGQSKSRPAPPSHNVLRLHRVQQNVRKAKYPWHPGLALFDLVRVSRCTDSRDKVYGILGLVTPDLASMIPVDYRKSVEEVYMDFAASIVRYTGSLEILGLSLQFPSGPDLLPSWVPDFRCELCYEAWWTVSTEHMRKPLVKPVVNAQSRLIAGGICLDELDALTATRRYQSTFLRQETDPGVVPASGPHPQSHMYGDFDGLKDAYWSTFIKIDEKKVDVAVVTIPRNVLEAQSSTDFLGKWVQEFYERNKEFEVAGHRLESFFATASGPETPETTSKHAQMEYKTHFERIVTSLAYNRMTFTRGGRLGLVPLNSRKGDAVYALHGYDSLAVLRRQVDAWTFVGPCYVHGLMEGDHPAILEGRVEQVAIA